jgi:hypothetical protein
VVILPARRLIGATCRGRSHRCLPVALKCHRCADRQRLDMKRSLARAYAKRILPRKWTSGWSAHVRYLAERPTPARQLYDNSVRPDCDSLQGRRSRGRSSDSVSTLSAPLVVEPSATPQRLQSLLIWGGGAPDVHVSLVADGGHGPTPTVAEVGGSTPAQMGGSATAVEEADESGAAPETTGSKCAAPKAVGSKRAAPPPKQVMSDRHVKKA